MTEAPPSPSQPGRFSVALLPGDGIGPEVVASARAALAVVSDLFGHTFDFQELLIGGAAIDAVGNPLPEDTMTACCAADAVLLGAVGGPRWDDPSVRIRPEQGLLGLRQALGVFANLRPVKPHAALLDVSPLRPDRLKHVDLLVVRELTGGIYFGEKGVEPVDGGERAYDVCSYTTAEIERIVRMAAGLAQRRSRRLASVDKANVLESSRLWRRVATRVVAEEFPDVQLEHVLVDACAMHLVLNPARFDVIVTENMFGDILTDEAAVLTGSIGLLPSASLGPQRQGRATRPGLYEPIHGSAPDIAGRGVSNPMGALLSAALLLRHSLGLEAEASAVERAVASVLAGGLRTADLGGGAKTSDVTAAVCRQLSGGQTGSDAASLTSTPLIPF